MAWPGARRGRCFPVDFLFLKLSRTLIRFLCSPSILPAWERGGSSRQGGTDVETRNIKWVGIALISLVGLIHLIEAPEYFAEYGAFWGLSFLANAVGAAVAAYGIGRETRDLGWTLGAVVAGGAFVLYVISRTVGLPGLPIGNFFEPIGIASLLVEGAFLALYAKTAARTTTAPARSPR